MCVQTQLPLSNMKALVKSGSFCPFVQLSSEESAADSLVLRKPMDAGRNLKAGVFPIEKSISYKSMLLVGYCKLAGSLGL